jgi:hypothetical protein
MDSLLKSLKTPAQHALYTIHHAFQKCGDVEAASMHCYHLVKAGYSLILKDGTSNEFKEQISKKQKGGFDIDDSLLVPSVYFNIIKQVMEKDLPEGWSLLNKKKAITTKKILQRLTSAATNNSNQSQSKTMFILKNLRNHLYTSLGTDIREGTADIALTLSMIPLCTKKEASLMNEIMDVLSHITALEISRRSMKISRRSAEILVLVEKLAAAGCQGRFMDQALEAARLSLPNSQNYDAIKEDTLNGLMSLNMWSSRSLLWLWRKGHVFHKVSEKDLKIALTVEDLCRNPPQFDDPSLPIVVDVGCGLGVTLLGLASNYGVSKGEYNLDLDWSKYNYLGSDLSLTAIQWATSLTLRRWTSGRCKFLHTSTETLLAYLEHTSVNVKLIFLQFPTPYRLQDEISLKDKHGEIEKKGPGCNEKLPLGPDDPSFMANPKILTQMVTILENKKIGYDQDRYLLMQSNCEDVAIKLYDSLVDLGLTPLENTKPRISFDEQAISSRTKSWLQIQHRLHKNDSDVRRSVGSHWADEPLIPIRTETEVSSEYQSTSVHRCLFKR